MTFILRCALAFGLVGAFALAVSDAADAKSKSKRAAYRKAPVPAFVGSPYARDPGCYVTYDSSGFAQPPYLNPNCEAAFRAIYPPRR